MSEPLTLLQGRWLMIAMCVACCFGISFLAVLLKHWDNEASS